MRKLKKAGDSDRCVALKRRHDKVIVKVVESAGIKTNSVFSPSSPRPREGMQLYSWLCRAMTKFTFAVTTPVKRKGSTSRSTPSRRS